MKKKELIIANGLLVILVITTGILTFNMFSNAALNFDTASAKEMLSFEEETVEIEEEELPLQCSKKNMIKLSAGNDRHLIQLQKYQQACNSFAVNKMMIFTTFPSDTISANEDATFMANKLKKFRENGISPIVIVEPYAGDESMNYKDFMNGNYDWILDIYFTKMKQLGITDEMMGMWVPFPESNTPNWNNKDTKPKDFAVCVNRYFALLKKTFPNAKGGILLNATTYDPNDIEWDRGDYLSLMPYLIDIDHRLVDSFGIQGFPWVSAADKDKKKIFRASEFLQPDLILEAARELHVKDIWINTGTFATKYANDQKKINQVSLNERRGILNGILEETQKIKSLQLNEYRISINLFSEDKSSFQEATDWSYFQSEDSTSILREFLSKAEAADIPVSLYDVDRAVPIKSQNENTPSVRPTIMPKTLNTSDYRLFPTKKPLPTATPSISPTPEEYNESNEE